MFINLNCQFSATPKDNCYISERVPAFQEQLYFTYILLKVIYSSVLFND